VRLTKIFSGSIILPTLFFLISTAAVDFVKAAEFEYPELNVTPRASDRIDQEAAREAGRRWSRHAPILFSGLMTLSAGILQNGNVDLSKDQFKDSPSRGMIVGGVWVGLMSYLATSYHPYESAAKELSTMPRKTVREQLARERYAEARIASAASLAKKLRYLSIFSNAAVSGYMLSKVEKYTLAQGMDILALSSAFAPLLFRNYWEEVAEEQADYKKRIYAPVASTGFLLEPLTNAPSPAFFLSFFF